MHIRRSHWPRGLRHELPLQSSITEIVDSNPTGGMDICVRLFCVCVVLYVGRGFATGCSPVQGALSKDTKILVCQ
jgi:hypothetical protein